VSLDEIDINLTHKCNLSCSFCSFGPPAERRDELGLPLVLRLLRGARDLGAKDVHFTGGEPTLVPHLVAAVTAATSLGFNVRLITNGTVLTGRLLDQLWDAGLRRLMVSLDGPAAVHDRLRGRRGVFRRTVAAVRRAARRGFSCRLNAVATSANVASLASVLEVGVEVNADIGSIFLFSPVGRGRDALHLALEPQRWREAFCGLQELAARMPPAMRVIAEKGYLYDDEPGIDFQLLTGRGTGCSLVSSRLDYVVIRADGEVSPCFFLAQEGGVSIGNVTRETLAAIIAGWPRDGRLEAIAAPPRGCAGCAAWDRCRGGCRGYAGVAGRPGPADGNGRAISGSAGRDSRCPGPGRARNSSGFVPLCPLIKVDLKTGVIGGSSEDVLSIRNR
jgi:radical SAM protein with 4Fe4S-binding SPASM domain